MDSRKPKRRITAQDVKGLRYFKSLIPLLERLHDVGTARDKAGQRQLHMDEYCILVLLWLYSPILTSLRALQQSSTLDKVPKKLGVRKASLGSLSESVRIFDCAEAYRAGSLLRSWHSHAPSKPSQQATAHSHFLKSQPNSAKILLHPTVCRTVLGHCMFEYCMFEYAATTSRTDL